MVGRVAWIAVALAGVVSSGCDSDEGTGDAIKIGLLVPFSETLKIFSRGMRNGAALAVSEINAAGGVLGKPLKLVSGRPYNTSAEARTQTEMLLEDGVVTIVGPHSSDVAQKITIRFKTKYKVPIISPAASAPILSDMVDSNLFFRTIASDELHGEIAASYAFETLGCRKAAILYENTISGTGLGGAFYQYFLSFHGQISAFRSFDKLSENELDQYTFEKEVEGLKLYRDRPDLIVLVTFAKEAAKITSRLRRYVDAGYRPKIFGFEGIKNQDFLLNAEPTVILPTQAGSRELGGLFGSSPIPPTETEDYQRFEERYIARFGFSPELYADGAYDAVYLTALALQRGKDPTRVDPLDLHAVAGIPKGELKPRGTKIHVGELHKAVELLRGGANIDYEGASGKVNWDERGDTPRGRYLIWRIKKQSGGSTQLEIKKEKVVFTE